MLRAACLLCGTAAVVAAGDVAQKASSDGTMLHERSRLYVVGVAGGALIWAAAIVLTRSAKIAVPGGLVLGGASGNLASIVVWGAVPNSLTAAELGFNLADVFVVGGFVSLAISVGVFAVANRDRLGEPVRLR